MAWRPSKYLIEGELDNTKRGAVTGWMRFVGLNVKITFDLKGDFHRDIRGAKIRLKGGEIGDEGKAAQFMKGFANHQTGTVCDITAGLRPHDCGDYPYVEWYGDENGRVVLELMPNQVEVVGTPKPWANEEPISRRKQQENMAQFVAALSRDGRMRVVLANSRSRRDTK